MLSKSVHLPLHAAEDDAFVDLFGFQQFDDRFIALRLIDNIVALLDNIVGRLLFSNNRNELGIIENMLGKVFDGLGHCSRKKQCLACLGNVFKYLFDLVKEAHVEHFICFIKYNNLRVEAVDLPFFIEVFQTPRSCHNDLHSFVNERNLPSIPHTTVYSQGTDARKASKMIKLVTYLCSQFTRWGNDQCALDLTFGDLVHHWQSECCSLACSCMRLGNQVFPFHYQRYRHLLNRTWLFEACNLHPFGEITVKIEFTEFHCLPLGSIVCPAKFRSKVVLNLSKSPAGNLVNPYYKIVSSKIPNMIRYIPNATKVKRCKKARKSFIVT